MRDDDTDTRSVLAALNHPASHAAVNAERALLAGLRGGCLAPVGAWAHVAEDGHLQLDAVVLSPDGQQKLSAGSTADLPDAVPLGRTVAEMLLHQGAAALIHASRAR